MKLQLTGKSYKTFTGIFGGVQFENGVSLFDVSIVDANRLGSLVGAKYIDGSDATEVDRISSMKSLDNPYRTTTRPLTEEEVEAINKKSSKKPLDKAKTKDEESKKIKKYTRKSLENIADKSGISGLRKIAVEFAVTSNRIESLIDKILEAQQEILNKEV